MPWKSRLLVLAALLAASAVAVRVSVVTQPVRALFVATLLYCILLCFSAVLRLGRVGRWAAALAVVVVAVWALVGSRTPDVEGLRRAYARSLGSYRGVRYVWGGETHSGIDCSGLARSALSQAMLHEGIRRANPRLLGPALWRFWWRDLAARDLLNGAHGCARVIGRAPRLAGYDTSRLLVGDMAVAESGIHVMIYYGDGRWIEASPDDKRVVINTAPAGSRRGWFNVIVTFVRWRALDH